MGSCFSTEMHHRATEFGISSFSNPFGTIFSPMALGETIEYIYNLKIPPFFNYNETFHCLLFANRFQNSSDINLSEQIKQHLLEARLHIESSTHIFITLGTATIYEHIEYPQWVGNCQKLPQNQFTKRQLTFSEISNSLEKIKFFIPKINPNVKLIFTVSPVRHLRDGLITSTVSKSLLRAALYEFCEKNKEDSQYGPEYFPSYEMISEELKDHHFYKDDKAHPTEEAIDFVFERFKQTYLLSGTN